MSFSFEGSIRGAGVTSVGLELAFPLLFRGAAATGLRLLPTPPSVLFFGPSAGVPRWTIPEFRTGFERGIAGRILLLRGALKFAPPARPAEAGRAVAASVAATRTMQ